MNVKAWLGAGLGGLVGYHLGMRVIASPVGKWGGAGAGALVGYMVGNKL